MKNPRLQTFEESGVMILPYLSLPMKNVDCRNHEYEKRVDGDGHQFSQCKKCAILKELFIRKQK